MQRKIRDRQIDPSVTFNADTNHINAQLHHCVDSYPDCLQTDKLRIYLPKHTHSIVAILVA